MRCSFCWSVTGYSPATLPHRSLSADSCIIPTVCWGLSYCFIFVLYSWQRLIILLACSLQWFIFICFLFCCAPAESCPKPVLVDPSTARFHLNQDTETPLSGRWYLQVKQPCILMLYCAKKQEIMWTVNPEYINYGIPSKIPKISSLISLKPDKVCVQRLHIIILKRVL